MIVYMQGNILNTPAITIVNTVNTVGVMGKGIALSLKNRYSDMYEEYQEACVNKQFHVGQLMYYKSVDHDVLLFPTKAHWRYPSRMKWIEDGLKTFCRDYGAYGISSIAFPMLGCGNGGLNWVEVKPLMEHYLNDLPIQVFVYTGMGPNPVWSDKPIKDYTGWLQSIALDFNINAVLQRFGDYLMLPYEFQYHGEKCQMLYSPGEIRISSDSQTLTIHEDEFVKLWDSWLAKGYVEIEDQETKLLPIMLMSMGYMEPIYIEKEDGVVPGFQLLLMCDRAMNNGGER